MSTELIPFEFEGNRIRAVEVEGNVYFVASDLATALGYRMASDMTRVLEPDEKGTQTVRTLGGPQDMLVITESGLYSVILRRESGYIRNEEARKYVRRFQRWVTHEVLPTIRRTGKYEAPALTDDQIVHQALQITTRKIEELEAKVAADAPKVLFADAVSASHTSILVGDLAKILRGNGVEIGANRLFQRLRDEGYLVRRKGTDWNMPTQYSMDLGLFEIKETAITHSDGHITVSKTPKVTGKGQTYFVDRYLQGVAA